MRPIVGQKMEVYRSEIDAFVPGKVLCCEDSTATVDIGDRRGKMRINLKTVPYKIEFTVGEFSVPNIVELIGKDVEVLQRNLAYMQGYVKKADVKIGCNLIAFENGKQEWIDLSLSTFKLFVIPMSQEVDREGIVPVVKKGNVLKVKELSSNKMEQSDVPAWYRKKGVAIEVCDWNNNTIDAGTISMVNGSRIRYFNARVKKFQEIDRFVTPHKIPMKKGWPKTLAAGHDDLTGHVIEVIGHSNQLVGRVVGQSEKDKAYVWIRCPTAEERIDLSKFEFKIWHPIVPESEQANWEYIKPPQVEIEKPLPQKMYNCYAGVVVEKKPMKKRPTPPKIVKISEDLFDENGNYIGNHENRKFAGAAHAVKAKNRLEQHEILENSNIQSGNAAVKVAVHATMAVPKLKKRTSHLFDVNGNFIPEHEREAYQAKLELERKAKVAELEEQLCTHNAHMAIINKNKVVIEAQSLKQFHAHQKAKLLQAAAKRRQHAKEMEDIRKAQEKLSLEKKIEEEAKLQDARRIQAAIDKEILYREEMESEAEAKLVEEERIKAEKEIARLKEEQRILDDKRKEQEAIEAAKAEKLEAERMEKAKRLEARKLKNNLYMQSLRNDNTDNSTESLPQSFAAEIPETLVPLETLNCTNFGSIRALERYDAMFDLNKVESLPSNEIESANDNTTEQQDYDEDEPPEEFANHLDSTNIYEDTAEVLPDCTEHDNANSETFEFAEDQLLDAEVKLEVEYPEYADFEVKTSANDTVLDPLNATFEQVQILNADPAALNEYCEEVDEAETVLVTDCEDYDSSDWPNPSEANDASLNTKADEYTETYETNLEDVQSTDGIIEPKFECENSYASGWTQRSAAVEEMDDELNLSDLNAPPNSYSDHAIDKPGSVDDTACYFENTNAANWTQRSAGVEEMADKANLSDLNVPFNSYVDYAIDKSSNLDDTTFNFENTNAANWTQRSKQTDEQDYINENDAMYVPQESFGEMQEARTEPDTAITYENTDPSMYVEDASSLNGMQRSNSHGKIMPGKLAESSNETPGAEIPYNAMVSENVDQAEPSTHCNSELYLHTNTFKQDLDNTEAICTAPATSRTSQPLDDSTVSASHTLDDHQAIAEVMENATVPTNVHQHYSPDHLANVSFNSSPVIDVESSQKSTKSMRRNTTPVGQSINDVIQNLTQQLNPCTPRDLESARNAAPAATLNTARSNVATSRSTVGNPILPHFRRGLKVELTTPNGNLKGAIHAMLVHPAYQIKDASSKEITQWDLTCVKGKVLLNTKCNGFDFIGFKIDVYQKATRSIETGKIVDGRVDGIKVKMKDGDISWFDLASNKLKLRLPRHRKKAEVDSSAISSYWERYFDKEVDAFYYVDRITNTTQWESPATDHFIWQKVVNGLQNTVHWYHVPSERIHNSLPKWIKGINDEGKVYFTHSKSGKVKSNHIPKDFEDMIFVFE